MLGRMQVVASLVPALGGCIWEVFLGLGELALGWAARSILVWLVKRWVVLP